MSDETQKVDENKVDTAEGATVVEAKPAAPRKVVPKKKKRPHSAARKPEAQKPAPILVDNTPTDQKVDLRSTEQMIKDGVNSVNKVLLPDWDGPVEMKFPVMRDPETKQMTYETRRFRWVDTPHEEVLYYTQSTIIDLNSGHTATVVVGNRRTPVVFDRTYTHNGRVYHRCAWIPDKIVRAGVLYEKKIDKITRQPKAALKKIKGTNTPLYQIVGQVQTDYRDLERIFVRVFIKKGVPVNIEEDDKLLQFMHESTPPIMSEMEVG